MVGIVLFAVALVYATFLIWGGITAIRFMAPMVIAPRPALYVHMRLTAIWTVGSPPSFAGLCSPKTTIVRGAWTRIARSSSLPEPDILCRDGTAPRGPPRPRCPEALPQGCAGVQLVALTTATRRSKTSGGSRKSSKAELADFTRDHQGCRRVPPCAARQSPRRRALLLTDALRLLAPYRPATLGVEVEDLASGAARLPEHRSAGPDRMLSSTEG
jgi:hypothetical protein